MEEHFKEKTSGEAEVGSSCVEAPSFQNNMQFSVLCHKVPLVTNLRLLSQSKPTCMGFSLSLRALPVECYLFQGQVFVCSL